MGYMIGAVAEEDPDGDGTAVSFNLRYLGQYYDPTTGRYLTPDPIGLDGGLARYVYANGNPVMYIDPYGLWGIGDPLPQSAVDFSGGLGDALLLEAGEPLRNLLGVDCGVNKCSNAYKCGSWASYAFVGARAAYAGLAKGYSIMAPTSLAASEFREKLKDLFRLGFFKNWRKFDRGGETDAELRQGAGKTNRELNLYSGGVINGGIYDDISGGSGCGCNP